MGPLTCTVRAFLRELGRVMLPRPETGAVQPASNPPTHLLRAAATERDLAEGLVPRGDAAATPPWSGPDVAQVLAAGAALTVVMLALSLVVTWILSARARPDPKAVFFAMFDDRIRAGFPAQADESLATVLTGVNTVLRASPETPCVLLLVGAPDAEATALRMARTLAQAVQSILRGWPGAPSPPQELEVAGDSFASPDDYWRLYETLSRRLEEQRVVVVRDLQAVHPHAASAIAHLCDDTFPPFPQSVVVLLLSPREFFPRDVDVGALGGAAGGGGGGVEAVVLAEQCLLECWLARGPPPSSGAPLPAWASQDVLPSVLGRLTGRAVLVRPEPADLPEATAATEQGPAKEGAFARATIRAQ